MAAALRWATRLRLIIGFVMISVLAAGPAGQVAGSQAAQGALPDCGVAAAASGPPASAGLSPAVLHALSTIAGNIASARNANNVPSISVAIVQDQQAVYAQGFGGADIATQTPATPTTVYRIASNTKLFTATMMMQLRDQGLIKLDDPVNQYVPDVWYTYQAQDGSRHQVSPTFQQLASYTSGLPEYASSVTPQTAAQLFQQLQSVTTKDEPGTTFIYSDLGFSVLGESLAIIAGQAVGTPITFEQYVTTNILQPLGMNTTGFEPSGDIGSLFATGYQTLGPSWTAAPYAGRAAFDPGGGLLSNALDVAQFIMLQFRDGPAGGNQVLAGSSIQQMWQPVIGTPNGGEADIGWFTLDFQGQPMLVKNGILPGYNSQINVVPGLKLGVVVLINLSSNLVQGSATTAKINSMVLNTLAPAIAQSSGGQ